MVTLWSMLAALASGTVAMCIAATHAVAPSRVVIVPSKVEGDAPTTVSDTFDAAASAGVAAAGAEAARAPDGCATETCAMEAAGPNGYVVTTTAQARGSDYAISVRVLDGTGAVVEELSEPCEICTHEEAAQAVQALVQKLVAPVAEAAPPPPPPAETEPVTTPDPGPDPSGERRRMSDRTMGTLGFVGIGAGAAAIVGGVILFVVDERPVRTQCDGEQVDMDGECEFRYNTLGGGAALAITGALAVGAGVGLLLLRRGRPAPEQGKRADVAVSAGGVRVRF